MRKIFVVFICVLLCVMCVACDPVVEEQMGDKVCFGATVTEVYEGGILVEPDEGTSEKNSSDKISVSLSGLEDAPVLAVGDRVIVEHDGMIKESYPAQLSRVYSITKVE